MAALRVPLRLSECYVSAGDEALLFPEVSNYLTMDEVLAIFPNGVATHETFQHQGFNWRLLKRFAGGSGGTPTYIAILEPTPAQRLQPRSDLSAALAPPHPAAAGLAPSWRSSSLRSSASTGPDAPPASSSSAPASLSAPEHSSHAAAPPSSPASRGAGGESHLVVRRQGISSVHPSSPSGHNNSLALRASGGPLIPFPAPVPSTTIVAEAVAAMQNPLDRQKFIDDLLRASDSPDPMDRYKALIRLMSGLRRCNNGAASKYAAAGGRGGRLDAWDGGPFTHDLEELLRQVICVGECLARFGTADFVERSNSSRAITSRDYTTLLMQFLEQHGCAFHVDFIERLPQVLQDDALTVRTLLQTRCEANKLIFDQLIKAVGMESQSQAVVFNNTTATASPTNHASASPSTAVNAAAGATAELVAPPPKARSWRDIGLGLVVVVVGLAVVKNKVFGGRRREERLRDSGGRDDWDDGGRGGRRRGRGRGDREEFGSYVEGGQQRGGRAQAAAPLGGVAAERLAVRYLAACSEELSKAQRNAELLKHDWRIGQFRLAIPAANTSAGPSFPPGYEPFDGSVCNLHHYLNRLEGGGGDMQLQHHYQGGGRGATASLGYLLPAGGTHRATGGGGAATGSSYGLATQSSALPAL